MFTYFEGRAVARQTLRYRYGLPAPHAGGALYEALFPQRATAWGGL